MPSGRKGVIFDTFSSAWQQSSVNFTGDVRGSAAPARRLAISERPDH
jgi:hypothetical protein